MESVLGKRSKTADGAHQLNNELFKIVLLLHKLKMQVPSRTEFEHTLVDLNNAVIAASESGKQLVAAASQTMVGRS